MIKEKIRFIDLILYFYIVVPLFILFGWLFLIKDKYFEKFAGKLFYIELVIIAVLLFHFSIFSFVCFCCWCLSCFAVLYVLERLKMKPFIFLDIVKFR